MIRRLVESDIYNAAPDPTEEQIRFWLAECRTPGLLLSLVKKFPMLVQPMLEYRPLLQTAFGGSEEELQKEIKDEEELERKGDRIYWEPLSKDLEQLERVRRDRIRGAMVTKLWSVRTYNPLLLLIMSIYKKKTRAREAQEKRTWRLHGK